MVKIDYLDIVNFEIPEGYNLKETDKYQKYQYSKDSLTYICTILDNKTSRATNELELSKVYDTLFESITSSFGKHKIINKSIVYRDGLKVLEAKAQIEIFGLDRGFSFMLVAFPNRVYSFQHLHPMNEINTQDQFFNAVKFNPKLTVKDQLTNAIRLKIILLVGLILILFLYLLIKIFK